MTNQNLIIYQFPPLYKILKELDRDLNVNIIEAINEESIANHSKNLQDYLVITQKKVLKIDKQLVLNFYPIKINKLIEKINICFLKNQFNKQSQVNIKNYIIDLNSREISFNSKILKLTEKEVNTIVYLYNSGKAVSVDELEKNVWFYQSDLESHTVETHVYRLRKKIYKIFNDDAFIISEKNGYKIK